MIILATYPRSGSHFLVKHIRYRVDFKDKFIKTHRHDYSQGDYLISILRDPKDVMVSKITMDIHYDKEKRPLYFYFEEAKIQYISFFDHIIRHANMLIDYDEMLNDIEGVLAKISKATGAKVFSGTVSNTIDNPDSGHLATSTTSPYYDQCKDFIMNQDLSDFYEVYEKARVLQGTLYSLIDQTN